MPRTSKLESPGCPPLRVITTDVLGLVKVTESRGKTGIPKVVETWGSADASRGIVAASFADDRVNTLLAIARKNGSVELRNPLNGDTLTSFLLHEVGLEGKIDKDDAVVGLHLFKGKNPEQSSRLSTLLVCTENRKACLRSFKLSEALEDFSFVDSPNLWDVCSAGKILCSSLDGNDGHALFAGKGVEVNVWDLDKCQKIWTAKPPPANNLGIFTPTWFTAASFLSKHDRRKIVAGTNSHQVRLYDISAQRRPVFSVDFRESSIKSVAEDVDGNTVYVGTGSGDLASFDMRTGRLLGCFIGKCCGSIRSIARHPDLQVIASCGLDGYLRLWDTRSRQPLSAVFLKQHLTNVAFDSSFSDEVATGAADERYDSEIDNLEEARARECEDDEPAAGVSRKLSKGKKAKRAKTRKREIEDDGLTGEAVVETTLDEESNGVSRVRQKDPSPKIASKVKSASKKRKHKPRSDDS
ncbi:unnamed protein product [Spirodela intermedia]|uniref:Uncharacterized protein n=1 Tax=Spirodela intermedia TaxID=51605 RepID=A0A7I8L2X9_SPIIN|nr:unnamed protein product [Spirodela intermedia]